MRKSLMIISLIGLIFTILPSFLVFYRVIEMQTHFQLMLLGTFLWFVSAPFWMKDKSLEDGE